MTPIHPRAARCAPGARGRGGRQQGANMSAHFPAFCCARATAETSRTVGRSAAPGHRRSPQGRTQCHPRAIPPTPRTSCLVPCWGTRATSWWGGAHVRTTRVRPREALWCAPLHARSPTAGCRRTLRPTLLTQQPSAACAPPAPCRARSRERDRSPVVELGLHHRLALEHVPPPHRPLRQQVVLAGGREHLANELKRREARLWVTGGRGARTGGGGGGGGARGAAQCQSVRDRRRPPRLVKGWRGIRTHPGMVMCPRTVPRWMCVARAERALRRAGGAGGRCVHAPRGT